MARDPPGVVSMGEWAGGGMTVRRDDTYGGLDAVGSRPSRTLPCQKSSFERSAARARGCSKGRPGNLMCGSYRPV